MVATGSDPNLGAIRLAWWRERLDALDAGQGPPAEPRLQAVARELLPQGVTGKALSKLEDAWLPLLEPFPWGETQVEGLKLRGRILFGIGAGLLGGPLANAETAGELWSLVDGADHCSDLASQEFLFAKAREVALPTKAPHALRPLTVIAALAVHDLGRGAGGARRVSAALAHRIRGTFPRQI